MNKSIIASSEVHLDSLAFHKLKKQCESWKLSNNFLNPGPIQLYGPMANCVNMTLTFSYQKYTNFVKKIEELTEKIRGTCRFVFNFKESISKKL